MAREIPGIHHVTAICGPPQPNLDFYTGPLGQRLVKKTVNFDAPDTYHLYYGDRTGSPGTILTFFPFADVGPGRAGPGMASAVAYAVPPSALDDGFHSVTLWLSDPMRTAGVLTDLFGYEAVGHEASDGMERLRFRSRSRARGSVVDLVRSDARSI